MQSFRFFWAGPNPILNRQDAKNAKHTVERMKEEGGRMNPRSGPSGFIPSSLCLCILVVDSYLGSRACNIA